MASIKVINFSILLKRPLEVVKKPVRQNILNAFDNLGNIVSLGRIREEENADFRERIWDAAVHPAGPDFMGVSHGMARDFGFLSEKTITIDLKLNSDGSATAVSPRVNILSNRVVLYSDWRPDGTAVIDKEIRIYREGDAGFYLSDLVAEINSSTHFSASMYSGIRPNMHSSNLLRKSSNFRMSEAISTDKRQVLRFDTIIRGSLVFEDVQTFRTEVETDPADTGEYRVDYSTGEVFSYDLPDGRSSCDYQAALIPMTVMSTPIQLFTLQDDDFLDELHYKKTTESGEEIRSLPNAEGSEIFHQLFLETQIFWSK